jgi:excisionase family DNA binding protein
MTKELLRIEEVADQLGIGRTKCYELLAPQGPLPVIRIGRAVRIPAAAVQEWIKQQIEQGREVSDASGA